MTATKHAPAQVVAMPTHRSDRELGPEYELDHIEVTEGIQMTGRQGSE